MALRWRGGCTGMRIACHRCASTTARCLINRRRLFPPFRTRNEAGREKECNGYCLLLLVCVLLASVFSPLYGLVFFFYGLLIFFFFFFLLTLLTTPLLRCTPFMGNSLFFLTSFFLLFRLFLLSYVSFFFFFCQPRVFLFGSFFLGGGSKKQCARSG